MRTIAFLLSGALFGAFSQTPCDGLKALSLPDTSITAAESVPAGPLRNPTAPAAAGQPPMLPAHCRVAAVVKPSADSHIEMEVWMPAADWNGKCQAVGNGGLAGSINFAAMAAALQEGYATASTDTGHKGPSASFAAGHPEKVVDYAYRAVHEMAVKSKAILTAYYGRGPRLSYWNSCSNGGRQGLMEAQRYPEDFDGIIAGASGINRVGISAWYVALAAAIGRDPASFVPAPKTALLNQAVLAACDALDGVKDGLLNNPLLCHFDPATLLCRGGDADNCLTAPQVEAVKMAYAPARKKTGELIYPGMPPGSELGWSFLAGGEPGEVRIGTFKYVLHQDPKWDWRAFDLDRDTALAEEKAGYLNAINPDLTAFQARGGKLLMYHGWNDPQNSAQNSINYYSSVLAKMGQKQEDWLRLFLAPGMGHCRGGPGPDQFNAMGALERWRESGVAPAQITASHVSGSRVDMTRPLCPFPQVAKWTGVGSTKDAANFVCK